ncbi:hypothetical protein BB561_000277 [Smittium simulii]|uniref:Uncharacterized protein n=1 Tax=Smittium simulii TaxID=133385 RepID=A0A2T9YZX6_9FUNG|nr:hypothetical protein BB561_000277 [Smittium simulii]
MNHKKIKTVPSSDAPKNLVSGSRIFEPFRTIGHVSNSIPHSILYRGQTPFITTCIGNSFNIYDIETLNLLFVGPQFDTPIEALASFKDETFVAVSNKVFIATRGKLCGEFSLQEDDSIFDLLVYGELLIGLSTNNSIYVWTIKNRELYTQIDFNKEDFVVTCVIHPSTYLDKIAVGSKQGSIRIINIKTRAQIFQSKSYASPITTLEQSPALDIIAVGFLNGSIKLINIMTDQELLSFSQDGKVTSIAFRTDLDNQAMMATSNLNGDIAIWNLDKHRLVINMKSAHDGPIGKISFLNNQPLLVTTGDDNKIIEWLFDNFNGGESSWPRQLKQRSGHFANPTKIKYYGNDGKQILSVGRDQTLRLFSIVRDSQNVELSQRLKLKKFSNGSRLPIITSFASEEIRQKDWDNIIACHYGQAFATTWSMASKAIGRHQFSAKDSSIIKEVAMSPCGNFGYIGTLSGSVEMFNLQSGFSRRVFEGHTKAITGIQTDQSNRLIYTSSLDKTIIYHKHKDGSIHKTINLDCVPSTILFHKNSDLLAAVCDDLAIRVFDGENGTLVRVFTGHKNQITDIAFSPDGRWLVSSSLDSTIRTWDLPTGNLIDIFKTTSVPISLDFSPTFDFLITCHPDRVGLCLWTNKTMFEHVELGKVKDDMNLLNSATVNLPSSELGVNDDNDEIIQTEASDLSQQGNVNGLARDKSADEDSEDIFILPDQILEQSLLTTSSLSVTKWQTLLNLDTIKKRNRPVMPAKAPESAPFFLPTVVGLEPKFEKPKKTKNKVDSAIEVNSYKEKDQNDPNQIKDTLSLEEDTRVSFGINQVETEITKLLDEGASLNNYQKFNEYLLKQSVSSIDFEIRSINSLDTVKQFLKGLLWQLKERKQFDAVMAVLSVALQVHGDMIFGAIRENIEENRMEIDGENTSADIFGNSSSMTTETGSSSETKRQELLDLLQEIRNTCNKKWGKVDELIRYNLCLVDYYCA